MDLDTEHTIYVKLLEEAVLVYRPVLAEHLSEDIWSISPQIYEKDIEKWEYEPGDYVVCRTLVGQEGEFLAAVAKARI